MYQVGKFEKVSFKEFSKYITESNKKEIYDNLNLPKRATKGSAGYDFYLPISIKLNPDYTITIPTGIKARIDEGWFLACFPRSSLGFKYKLQFDNTVGIIDSDYYSSDNEGHIFIKMTNNSDKLLSLSTGDRFAQGIFLPYGITYDDNAENIRIGGIGSTNI